MYSPESEKYGFPREFFPMYWRGHKLVLLTNNAHVTVDGRLSVHINISCQRCNSESVVRWRFDDSYTEYKWAASLSKMLVLAGVKDGCDEEFKTQIP